MENAHQIGTYKMAIVMGLTKMVSLSCAPYMMVDQTRTNLIIYYHRSINYPTRFTNYRYLHQK